MAFTQFPSVLYFKVSETNELFRGASFTVEDNQQLRYVEATIYNVGSFSTDRFRLKLFTDSALTKLYATSDWLDLSDISGLSASWLGRVRFDFAEASMPWLSSVHTYHLGVEASNYTRSGDTRYVGWALDWPLPVNSQSVAPQYGIHFEAYGLRRIQR